MKHACSYATLLLLAACGGGSPQSGLEASASGVTPDVAPPIIPPHEVADPAQPPSYEVAIAGAAAERNAAQDRCAKQPEAVRTKCEQEANAAFAEQQSDLADLRGNQQ
jgi:hypothetical protein